MSSEKKYLDETGLAEVAEHVNTRLKTVTSMPSSADVGAVRLYAGETTSDYTSGHIYKRVEGESAELVISVGSSYYQTTLSELPEEYPYSMYGGWQITSCSSDDVLSQALATKPTSITSSNENVTVSWSSTGITFNDSTMKGGYTVTITFKMADYWKDISPTGSQNAVLIVDDLADVETPVPDETVACCDAKLWLYTATDSSHGTMYPWMDSSGNYVWTLSSTPSANDVAYSNDLQKVYVGYITDASSESITVNGTAYERYGDESDYEYSIYGWEEKYTVDQTYSATSTNAQSGVAVASAIAQSISDTASLSLIDKVRESNWSKMGENYNWDKGFLRQGRTPKKVVVIGNSMTYHGVASYWAVTDLREMAASTPTSGWVSKVYRELAKYNSDLVMYKANGATWETATLGSRAYSDLSGNAVALMNSTGCEATSLTIDDVLTEDVDIVICQLYENISAPSTVDDANTLVTDYANLYDAIKEKCPNAFMYQFCGFWQNWRKHQAVNKACYKNHVEPIYAWTLNPLNTGYSSNMDSNAHSQYESQTGDSIYDNDGNEITTVTSTVAGHPNDRGFAVMAAHVICRLYNAYFFGDTGKYYPTFKYESSDDYNTLLDSTVSTDEMFVANTASATLSDTTTYDYMYKATHNLYESLFDYMIFYSGLNLVTVNYLNYSDSQHGLLETISTGSAAMYQKFEQRVFSVNNNHSFTREVILSATDSSFKPWIPQRSVYNAVDGNIVYTGEMLNGSWVKRLCIIPSSDVAVTNSSWTSLSSVSSAVFDAHPTAFLKVTAMNTTSIDTGSKSKFIKYNIRFTLSDEVTDISVASDTNFTWSASEPLWVDYI